MAATNTEPEDAVDRVGRHVAVIGPMGVGKSTVGAELAIRLGRPYLDNDDLLAARFGATAAELAARLGLDGLHDLEAAILDEQLAGPAPAVLTAASSTIERTACRERLRTAATVVALDADADALAARVPERSNRPAEALDPAARQARRDAYRASADLVVRTSGRPVEATVAEVVAGLAALGVGPSTPAAHGMAPTERGTSEA